MTAPRTSRSNSFFLSTKKPAMRNHSPKFPSPTSTVQVPPLLPITTPLDQHSQAGGPIFRLKLWYFFYFAAQFTQLFLPLVLEKVMLFQSSTIGVLMAIRRFTIFVIAPLFAFLCDITFLHRQLLTAAHACYYFCTFLLTQVRSLAPVTLIIILREAFIAGCEPAVNTATFAKLLSTNQPASKFGTIRFWGSVGWGLASLLVPIISDHFFSSSMIPILYAQIALGIPTVLVIALGVDLSPRLFRQAQEVKPTQNGTVNEEVNESSNIASDRYVDIEEMKKYPDFENLNSRRPDGASSSSSLPTSYCSTSISSDSSTPSDYNHQNQPETDPELDHLPIHPPTEQSSTEPHQSSNRLATLCVLAALDQGIILGAVQTTLLLYFAACNVSVSLIGVSVLVGCISEGAMFFADHWVRRRFKSDRNIIQFGIVANGFALLAYISIRYIAETAWWRPVVVLLTEGLFGCSYALFVSSIVQMADKVAPPEWQTGGQGVVTSLLYGIGPALGALFGGWTYQQYGVGVLYGALAGFNTVVYLLLVV